MTNALGGPLTDFDDGASTHLVPVESRPVDKEPGSAAHPKRSRASRLAWALGLAAFVLVWSQTVAPRSVGGPAGFVVIRGVSMLPTFKGGDLVITHPSASYGKGDIVAYTVPKGQFGAGIVVIHRIIGGSAQRGFVIQGDNNGFIDPWHPRPHDIVGKAWVHVPRLGLLLIFLHAPVPLASLAAGVVVAMIVVPPKKKSPKPQANVVDLRPKAERRFNVRVKRVHVGAALVVGVSTVLLLAGGATFASGRHPVPSRRQRSGTAVLTRRACLASDRPTTEAETVDLAASCAALAAK